VIHDWSCIAASQPIIDCQFILARHPLQAFWEANLFDFVRFPQTPGNEPPAGVLGSAVASAARHCFGERSGTGLGVRSWFDPNAGFQGFDDSGDNLVLCWRGSVWVCDLKKHQRLRPFGSPSLRVCYGLCYGSDIKKDQCLQDLGRVLRVWTP